MKHAHCPVAVRLRLDPVADVRLGSTGDEEPEREGWSDPEKDFQDCSHPVRVAAFVECIDHDYEPFCHFVLQS
ncbi:hypothetical protein RHS01_11114 [Rhizoctonia solani]|uniref:Uncharacterized protein n=1 Tax=Rhizoctonia solani TaxID=456999 RepID=A0A8H7M1T6_9AGAM|nr:hypothetical protein RHS01_11114 [Rhizoctonia solani]